MDIRWSWLGDIARHDDVGGDGDGVDDNGNGGQEAVTATCTHVLQRD